MRNSAFSAQNFVIPGIDANMHEICWHLYGVGGSGSRLNTTKTQVWTTSNQANVFKGLLEKLKFLHKNHGKTQKDHRKMQSLSKDPGKKHAIFFKWWQEKKWFLFKNREKKCDLRQRIPEKKWFLSKGCRKNMILIKGLHEECDFC